MAKFSSQPAVILPMRKACWRCGNEKPLDDFYAGNGKFGKSSYCKDCERARRKTRYHEVDVYKGKRDPEKRLRILEARQNIKDGYKICGRCEQELPFSDFYKDPGAKSGFDTYCKRCQSDLSKGYRSASPGARLSLAFCTALGSARRKGIPFTIARASLIKMWEAQEGRCYYTGALMNYAGERKPESVSIDRVDSSKGYTPDNVVLCCNNVNLMKRDQSIDDFVRWCELIVRKAKGL